LDFNDTILQKENASGFQEIICGKAALCHLVFLVAPALAGVGRWFFHSFLSPGFSRGILKRLTGSPHGQ